MHINHCLTHLPQRFKSCLTEGWRRSDWVKWREYMLVFRCFKMKCVLFNMLATANTELTAVCESCDMYVDSFTWLWYVHLSQQIRQVFRWVSVPHVVVCVCVCLFDLFSLWLFCPGRGDYPGSQLRSASNCWRLQVCTDEWKNDWLYNAFETFQLRQSVFVYMHQKMLFFSSQHQTCGLRSGNAPMLTNSATCKLFLGLANTGI